MDIRELRTALGDLAATVVESGMANHSEMLEALADAARAAAPAAAEVLTDEQAPEVLRQRAFGVVHGVVLDALDREAQESLLLRLHPAPAYHLVA